MIKKLSKIHTKLKRLRHSNNFVFFLSYVNPRNIYNKLKPLVPVILTNYTLLITVISKHFRVSIFLYI